MTYKDVVITVVAAAASAAVFSGIGKKKKKKKKKKGKTGTGAKTIAFTAEGETTMTLPIGAEFIVTYDPAAPWKYTPQGTDTVPVVEQSDGAIRFKLAGPLAPDQPSQVYVMALDQNDDLMGQHKVTVFSQA